MSKFQEIEKHYEVLRKLWWDYWTQEVLFSYQWWIMVFLLIIPFFLWWRLVDKTRIIQISMVGLLTSGMAFILDQIGSSLGYWTYPYTLTHLERDLWAVSNFSLIPFSYMMIYQWFSKWKTYLLGVLLFALFVSFVAEPIFHWLGIYMLLNWKYIYSVPGYVLLGVFVKVVMRRFKEIEDISNSKE